MNEGMRKLCTSLNLPKPHKYCQDWEDEVSDSQRIGEFIQFYQKNNLTDEEKYLLMIIIINSFDDALYEEDVDISYWLAIEKMILSDIKIHEETVEYYCEKDKDIKDCFAVTTYMNRERSRLWHELKKLN